MQPRPARVGQVLQDVGQDVARDEKVAAARGYVDIADGLPLDAAAHQRAEKIAVRERVALKKSGAHGGDRTILARQPILVQIVRQVAADLALRRGKPAEKADRRAAQHLANEHLFPLREEIRRRRDVPLHGGIQLFTHAHEQHFFLARRGEVRDLFASVHGGASFIRSFAMYCTSRIDTWQVRQDGLY